jgi:hypothetical protein
VFLAVRPADLLASDEGQRVIAALGPVFAVQRQAWEMASGFKLEEIEHLLLTLHNNDAKFPRTSFVVTTKERFTAEQLLAKWGDPAAVDENSQNIHAGATWAYYIPPATEDERKFAMGDVRDIKLVAAEEGRPPAFFRDIERLRRTTDSQRHFTLIFFPQFLFNDDGEPLFAAERAKVRQPLATLLGEQVQAAGVSAHVGEQFYFELRMLASLDKEPHELARSARLADQVPTRRDYFVVLSPPCWGSSRSATRAWFAICTTICGSASNDQAIANGAAGGAAQSIPGGELLVATPVGRSSPPLRSQRSAVARDALQTKPV